jgi:hypothetical protein
MWSSSVARPTSSWPSTGRRPTGRPGTGWSSPSCPRTAPRAVGARDRPRARTPPGAPRPSEGGLRWPRFAARGAGFGGTGLTGRWRRQTDPKIPDRPHFSPLPAPKSTSFLTSLKAGFRFPRFSVRVPFTPVWEGCKVGLNWIEVNRFSSRVFATKTVRGFRFSDPSPQRIRGTRGYALTGDEIPARLSGFVVAQTSQGSRARRLYTRRRKPRRNARDP